MICPLCGSSLDAGQSRVFRSILLPELEIKGTAYRVVRRTEIKSRYIRQKDDPSMIMVCDEIPVLCVETEDEEN